MNLIHYLKPLPKEESWELFCRKAFVNSNGRCPKNMADISHQIAQRCCGLPLALVVVGGDVKISDILSLSYIDLPYYLKPCVLYLYVYPKDFMIRRTILVQLWLAEGFIEKRGDETLEDVAEDNFEGLVSRNILQVENMSLRERIKPCVVHDLLHDLVIAKAKEENFLGVIAG
ncbi:hypothetical protein AMTRI_Chr10g232210 [Amborella trichopoda]